MKSVSLPIVAVFILIASLQISVTSCKKETTTVRDTILLPADTIILPSADTAFSAALLTATPWKLQELRGVASNSAYYYRRGSNTNTQNYDNEYIVFNANKTGTYYDNGGTGTPMTWDFENATFTKLQFTVPFPSGTVTVHWEHIFYKNGGFRYGEYFINGSANSHSEGIRLPKDSGAVNLKLAD